MSKVREHFRVCLLTLISLPLDSWEDCDVVMSCLLFPLGKQSSMGANCAHQMALLVVVDVQLGEYSLVIATFN